MKKSFLLFFLVFLASAMLLAQKTSFNKKITNKESVYMSQIIPTENGEYLVLGARYGSVSPFESFPFATKFDKNANIQWCRQLVGAMGLLGFTNGIALKNGNYLAVYNGSQFKNHITMFDNKFTPIWTLQFGLTSTISNFDYFTELSDGNIAAVGNSSGTAGGFQIVILNPASGAAVWAKRYGNLGLNTSVDISSIRGTNDGELLISASLNSTNGAGSTIVKQKTTLLKIKRLNGGIIWQKELTSDFISYEYTRQILEDDKGNFYLHFTVFDNSSFPDKLKIGIVKLDKDANIEWFHTYGEPYLRSLLQTKDGNFLGIADDYKNKQRHYLSINQDGEITAQVQELSPAYLSSACLTNDGNLITIDSYYYNCDTTYHAYLQKRTQNGKGNCSEPSNLKVIKNKIVPSNYFKGFQVKDNFAPKKIPNFKVEDYPIGVSDETTFCQDTTYIKRCSGDVYAIGKNKYTKDGIYKDTITQGKCDSVVLSKLTFSKKGITTIDTTICAGKSFVFNQKNYNKAGLYQDSLKNSLGCDSLVSLNLKVQDINISVSDDVDVSAAEKTTLTATTNAADVQWQWLPPTYLSCTDCPNPTVTPLSSLNYTVKVKSKFGCSAEGNINVNVKRCNQVFIPNAFSPNGDGINDQLVVFASECATKVKSYSIFDRWGALVYELSDFPLNDSTYGWDGKVRNQAASTGVYVYKVSVEFTDGKVRNFSGDVLLE